MDTESQPVRLRPLVYGSAAGEALNTAAQETDDHLECQCFTFC